MRKTTDSLRVAPAEALMRARNNEIVLPLPTLTTLREILGSVEEAIARARWPLIRRREPMPVEYGGVPRRSAHRIRHVDRVALRRAARGAPVLTRADSFVRLGRPPMLQAVFSPDPEVR